MRTGHTTILVCRTKSLWTGHLKSLWIGQNPCGLDPVDWRLEIKQWKSWFGAPQIPMLKQCRSLWGHTKNPGRPDALESRPKHIEITARTQKTLVRTTLPLSNDFPGGVQWFPRECQMISPIVSNDFPDHAQWFPQVSNDFPDRVH